MRTRERAGRGIRLVRYLPILLVAATLSVFLASPPASGVARFGDVSEGRFYTSAVQWMVDNDITTGTSATCFSPDDPVTRGQAAAFIWRMENSPAAPPHSFVDIAAPWQQGPVSWMADQGITTGTTPSTYSPDDQLTRGQLAALLHRLSGEPAATGNPFGDVIRSWQVTPVSWLFAEGITTGTSQTMFSPDAIVTRGQLATFFHRYKGSPPVTVDPTSPACPPTLNPTDPLQVLVFHKTEGFRHDSIPAGIAAITDLGEEHDFTVTETDDAATFTDASLSPYDVIVFLSTTGDILDDTQEKAMERFIQAGNGFVGIHAASDTEYDWAWYGGLVGAYFDGHPSPQSAVVEVRDSSHPTMQGVSSSFQRFDEWYNFATVPGPEVTVLATLDESSYGGGTMGAFHPIMWAHEYDGGRSFYTGFGHTTESFEEPLVLTLLANAIEWAADSN